MYPGCIVRMYEISFAFDLGRSFESIHLKFGRTVVSMENMSSIVFASIRPNEGSWRLRKFENF